MNEILIYNSNPNAIAFSKYLQTQAKNYITGQKNDHTNIIDQGEKRTYAFPPGELYGLMTHIDTCRKNGIPAHISERQGIKDIPDSGIMLDFDMIFDNRPALSQPVTPRDYHKMTSCIIATLQKHLLLNNPNPNPNPDPAGTVQPNVGTTQLRKEPIKMHVAYTKKKSVVCVTDGVAPAKYKYGIHMLVPGIQVPRDYKRYLISQLKGDAQWNDIFRNIGVSGDPAKCLDENSAHVPVLFFGSCKRGGEPYDIATIHEVEIDTEFDMKTITDLDIGELEKTYLLPYEFGLMYEATYPDGRQPLVKKHTYALNPAIESQIISMAERTRNNLIDMDDILATDHGLSTLALHDPSARFLHQLLDILDPKYYTDYTCWRKVILALANTHLSYKPLAEWFSQKCPEKWITGGEEKLDEIWDSVSAGAAIQNPITKRSLFQWARESDPVRYNAIEKESYCSILRDHIFKYSGILEHAMFSDVLHAMLGDKFVSDKKKGTRGREESYWFEFIIPKQESLIGEVWKWRPETVPDELRLYITRQLSDYMREVTDEFSERRANAENEDQAKYYKDIVKNVIASNRKLHNSKFIEGILAECRPRFRKRGFIESLDKQGDLLGVGNGILKLGAECEFINYFHEYPVNRHTNVNYRRFDPENPTLYEKLVLDALVDIIVEPDARERILKLLSTGLCGNFKDAVMLLWEGGGANGKTFVVVLWANTLGVNYATKLRMKLLTGDHEEASATNSAFMRIKDRRVGYFDESNPGDAINPARLKEIVNPGYGVGSEKYETEEVFKMTSTLVVSTNYPFVIDTTDHGTWRRIWYYKSKIKFCINPDPNSPYEKKENEKFANEYVNDVNVQEAFLSILVYYFERLQKENRGSIKRVPSKTIDIETQSFRNSQDSINRFLTETFVVQEFMPDPPSITMDVDPKYQISNIANMYIEWHAKNAHGKVKSQVAAAKELENSALQKYIRRTANKKLCVYGCRQLEANEAPGPGEVYLGVGKYTDDDFKRDTEQYLSLRKVEKNSKWWLAPVVGDSPLADNIGAPGPSGAVVAVGWVGPSAAAIDDFTLSESGSVPQLVRTKLASDGLAASPDDCLEDLECSLDGGLEGLEDLAGGLIDMDNVLAQPPMTADYPAATIAAPIRLEDLEKMYFESMRQ